MSSGSSFEIVDGKRSRLSEETNNFLAQEIDNNIFNKNTQEENYKNINTSKTLPKIEIAHRFTGETSHYPNFRLVVRPLAKSWGFCGGGGRTQPVPAP